MLRKLLKHDIKNSYKVFLFLSLISLVAMSTLPLMFMEVDSTNILLPILFLLLFVIVMLFSSAFMFVKISKSLHDSFYKSEGYLTFTLPATSKEILFSKILTGTLWLTVYTISVSLGGFIMVLEMSHIFNESISSLLGMFDILLFIWTSGVDVTNVSDTLVRTLSIVSFILSSLWFIILIPLSSSTVHSNITRKTNAGRTVVVFILYLLASRVLIVAAKACVNTDAYLVNALIEIVFNLAFIIGGFFLTTYLMDFKIDVE